MIYDLCSEARALPEQTAPGKFLKKSGVFGLLWAKMFCAVLPPSFAGCMMSDVYVHTKLPRSALCLSRRLR